MTEIQTQTQRSPTPPEVDGPAAECIDALRKLPEIRPPSPLKLPVPKPAPRATRLYRVAPTSFEDNLRRIVAEEDIGRTKINSLFTKSVMQLELFALNYSANSEDCIYAEDAGRAAVLREEVRNIMCLMEDEKGARKIVQDRDVERYRKVSILIDEEYHVSLPPIFAEEQQVFDELLHQFKIHRPGGWLGSAKPIRKRDIAAAAPNSPHPPRSVQQQRPASSNHVTSSSATQTSVPSMNHTTASEGMDTTTTPSTSPYRQRRGKHEAATSPTNTAKKKLVPTHPANVIFHAEQPGNATQRNDRFTGRHRWSEEKVTMYEIRKRSGLRGKAEDEEDEARVLIVGEEIKDLLAIERLAVHEEFEVEKELELMRHEESHGTDMVSGLPTTRSTTRRRNAAARKIQCFGRKGQAVKHVQQRAALVALELETLDRRELGAIVCQRLIRRFLCRCRRLNKRRSLDELREGEVDQERFDSNIEILLQMCASSYAERCVLGSKLKEKLRRQQSEVRLAEALQENEEMRRLERRRSRATVMDAAVEAIRKSADSLTPLELLLCVNATHMGRSTTAEEEEDVVRDGLETLQEAAFQVQPHATLTKYINSFKRPDIYSFTMLDTVCGIWAAEDEVSKQEGDMIEASSSSSPPAETTAKEAIAQVLTMLADSPALVEGAWTILRRRDKESSTAVSRGEEAVQPIPYLHEVRAARKQTERPPHKRELLERYFPEAHPFTMDYARHVLWKVQEHHKGVMNALELDPTRWTEYTAKEEFAEEELRQTVNQEMLNREKIIEAQLEELEELVDGFFILLKRIVVSEEKEQEEEKE